MVGGGDNLPRCKVSPPPPQANIDYVHRDEIGENVSSILLKGFQKLQITRLSGADPEILKGGCTKFSGPELPCFRFDPFFILL